MACGIAEMSRVLGKSAQTEGRGTKTVSLQHKFANIHMFFSHWEWHGNDLREGCFEENDLNLINLGICGLIAYATWQSAKRSLQVHKEIPKWKIPTHLSNSLVNKKETVTVSFCSKVASLCQRCHQTETFREKFQTAEQVFETEQVSGPVAALLHLDEKRV